MGYEPLDCRVKNIDAERSGNTPVNIESETDISSEIELVIRIIPPAHMEGMVKDHSGDKLD